MEDIKHRKEYPPYKCKMCGEGDIENSQDICSKCGWQDCYILNENKDCFGGPSVLTFNQYKKVWDNNKEEIKKLPFGKYRLVKTIFESNPKIYGSYSEKQLEMLKKEIKK